MRFEGYTSSGTFVDTFANVGANGCDSIRTLTLTVFPSATGSVTQTICDGETFEGYASSGTFVDTFANAGANGCDSIRILNLTVSSLPAVPTITQSGNTLTSSTATQYQWYLNGNLLPGETNQTLIITTNGVYTVQVTNGASCSILSTPFNAIFNGINQVNTNIHVNIFPNPTNGIVNLLFSNFPNAENISIRLYNEVGQQVVDKIIAVSGKNFSLVQSLQEFSAGVYFIQLQQGTWIYGERILRSN